MIRFAWAVAVSHMRSRKHEAGVSAITLVSMVGVTVGVMALIMVLAVMEGFEIDLRQKILGSNAHVVVRTWDNAHFDAYEPLVEELAEFPGVDASAPFIFTEVVLQSRYGVAWAYLNGVDVARSGKVERMLGELIYGARGELNEDSTEAERLAVLEELHSPPFGVFQEPDDTTDLPGIILGEDLANGLQVHPGSRLQIINPSASQSVGWGMTPPPIMYVRVAGIFDSGMYEYDTKWSYVTLEDAQSVLRLGNVVGDVVSGVEVMASDIREAGVLADELELTVPPYLQVDSWEEMNDSLFSALKLEKIAMGLILSLIVVVASLNIVGSLILVVVTRAREISIMRAMGASSVGVRTVFMLEGLVIGVVGTTLGTALGLLGCWGLARYEFPLDTDVYYLDTLPVVVEPATVVVVAVSALTISFLATLYPAGVAARLDPVEGLRYE